MINLNISSEEKNGRIIIQMHGDLNMFSAKTLREAIQQKSEKYRTIILDFSNVKSLDSSAIGNLIMIQNGLKKNDQGRLIVFGLSGILQSIFEVTRADKVITVTDTLEEALSAN